MRINKPHRKKTPFCQVPPTSLYAMPSRLLGWLLTAEWMSPESMASAVNLVTAAIRWTFTLLFHSFWWVLSFTFHRQAQARVNEMNRSRVF